MKGSWQRVQREQVEKSVTSRGYNSSRGYKRSQYRESSWQRVQKEQLEESATGRGYNHSRGYKRSKSRESSWQRVQEEGRVGDRV